MITKGSILIATSAQYSSRWTWETFANPGATMHVDDSMTRALAYFRLQARLEAFSLTRKSIFLEYGPQSPSRGGLSEHRSTKLITSKDATGSHARRRTLSNNLWMVLGCRCVTYLYLTVQARFYRTRGNQPQGYKDGQRCSLDLEVEIERRMLYILE